MGQGLQVWDEQGRIILDTNHRITTFLGQLSTQKSDDNLTFRHPLLLNNGYFFIITPLVLSAVTRITVNKSTDTLTFAIAKSNAPRLEILIGIY